MDPLTQRFITAIGITESNGHTEAWGDSGQAMGRFQMHPSFVWQYGPDDVELTSTWDEVGITTLEAFVADRREAVGHNYTRLAQEFHLGVHAVATGKWDEDYHNRFVRAWAASAPASHG